MRFLLFILFALTLAAQPFSLRDPMMLGALKPKASAPPSGGNGLLNGLVAYYKCDDASGGLSDASGNGNNATEDANQPTYSVLGKIGTAVMLFNNSDNFHTPVSTAGYADISYSIWLTTTNGLGFFMYLDHADNGTGWFCDSWDNGNGTLTVRFELMSDSTIDCRGTAPIDTEGSGWHLITGAYNGATATANIYVDGVLSGTASGNPVVASVSFLAVGGRDGISGGGGDSFAGAIDEVGVWSKTLTADDAALLYNSGAGLPFNSFTH